MKKFFAKLWDTLNDPRYEKAFMILLPCVSLLIAVLILAPQIKAFSAQIRTVETLSDDADFRTAGQIQTSPSPSLPSPSPSPQPSDSPEEKIQLKLFATSNEKDLYIQVCDENGNSIEDIFQIAVDYPGEDFYVFDTGEGGACYIAQLYAGEYKISMEEHEEYKTAAPISCTVKEHIAYEKIENISAIVEVKDVDEVVEEPLKPGSAAETPVEVVAEVIITPPEAEGEGNVIVEEHPVLDANGNQLYTYSYNVGPNGFLLIKGTEEESEVLPVDENNDGVLDYGLYYVESEPAEDGNESDEQGYYVSEILFNEDNTPVEKYDITATPVTDETAVKVGWQTIDGNMYYYDSSGNAVTGLKNIDGKVYYFNKYGVKAKSVGIDVSYYNEDINWSAVKAQGIDFAIIRLGGRTWQSGQLYSDSRTREYLNGAKGAGIKVGAYFYSTAIDAKEAVEEASVALELLGGTSLDYPIFFDTEYSGIYPEARSDTLSSSQRAEIANAFCQTIINSGYAAGVYSGEYFYNSSIDYSAISQYTIWLASYTSDNALPGFAGRYDIWQFTPYGQVDGIVGGVDMNVIF